MFETEIAKASASWGIPVPWIQAIIETESSWNPNALNSGGDRGLMQVSPATAHAYGITNLDSLFNPSINIDLGTHILADFRARIGDDLQALYSAYNSGNPNTYLINPQVASNVQRFIANLQAYLAQDPLIATTGSAGGLIIAVLTWLWIASKKKKKG